MPYSARKNGNKITVTKKDTGEVVGHTTPENYKGYMAALHMHEKPDHMCSGGCVGYSDGGQVDSFMDPAALEADKGGNTLRQILAGTGGVANKLMGSPVGAKDAFMNPAALKADEGKGNLAQILAGLGGVSNKLAGNLIETKDNEGKTPDSFMDAAALAADRGESTPRQLLEGTEGVAKHLLPGYSEGGEVKSTDEKDPTNIPPEVAEYVDKMHKEQRESRPDESWRITPKEDAPHVAPYKKDNEGELDKAIGVLPEDEKELPHYDDGGTVDDQGGNFGEGPTTGVEDNSQEDAFRAGVDPTLAENNALPLPPQFNGFGGGGNPAGGATGDFSRNPLPVASPKGGTVGSPVKASGTIAPNMTDEDFMNRAGNMLGLNPQSQASFLNLLGKNAQKGQIGAGIAGIGDAIASGGTLGKVNPGGMKASEELIQNKTKQGIEGAEALKQNALQNFGIGQTLRQNAPLSTDEKAALKPLADKVGLSLDNMPREMALKLFPTAANIFESEARIAETKQSKADSAISNINRQYAPKIEANNSAIDAIKTQKDQLKKGVTPGVESVQAAFAQMVSPNGKLNARILGQFGPQSVGQQVGGWLAKNGTGTWTPQMTQYFNNMLDAKANQLKQENGRIKQQAGSFANTLNFSDSKKVDSALNLSPEYLPPQRITSETEYKALPSGTSYIFNGRQGIKS